MDSSPTQHQQLVELLSKHKNIDARLLRHISPIGHGAFAEVDLCSQLVTARSSPNGPIQSQVAVKRFLPECMHNPALFNLICNEVEVLATLKHPFIVKELGIGFVDHSSPQAVIESFYMVQEYVPGGHLRKVVYNAMLRAGSVYYRRRDALKWMHQLASALAYLHGRTPKIMHRDIKLENLMLSDTDLKQADVRLIDFGLCVQLQGYAIQEEGHGHVAPTARPEQQANWDAAIKELHSFAGRSRRTSSIIGEGVTNSLKRGMAFGSMVVSKVKDLSLNGRSDGVWSAMLATPPGNQLVNVKSDPITKLWTSADSKGRVPFGLRATSVHAMTATNTNKDMDNTAGCLQVNNASITSGHCGTAGKLHVACDSNVGVGNYSMDKRHADSNHMHSATPGILAAKTSQAQAGVAASGDPAAAAGPVTITPKDLILSDHKPSQAASNGGGIAASPFFSPVQVQPATLSGAPAGHHECVIHKQQSFSQEQPLSTAKSMGLYEVQDVEEIGLTGTNSLKVGVDASARGTLCKSNTGDTTSSSGETTTPSGSDKCPNQETESSAGASDTAPSTVPSTSLALPPDVNVLQVAAPGTIPQVGSMALHHATGNKAGACADVAKVDTPRQSASELSAVPLPCASDADIDRMALLTYAQYASSQTGRTHGRGDHSDQQVTYIHNRMALREVDELTSTVLYATYASQTGASLRLPHLNLQRIGEVQDDGGEGGDVFVHENQDTGSLPYPYSVFQGVAGAVSPRSIKASPRFTGELHTSPRATPSRLKPAASKATSSVDNLMVDLGLHNNPPTCTAAPAIATANNHNNADNIHSNGKQAQHSPPFVRKKDYHHILVRSAQGVSLGNAVLPSLNSLPKGSHTSHGAQSVSAVDGGIANSGVWQASARASNSDAGAGSTRHGQSSNKRNTIMEKRSASMDEQQVYDMTQGAGSYMYMAPEVFKGLPYNEKADVFSFAICLYEVLHLQLLLSVVTRDVGGGPAAQQAVIDYAAFTASGYRPPLSPALPPVIADLLTRCWSVNPLQRPTMQQVVDTLTKFMSDSLHELDEWDRNMAGPCAACCSIQ